MAETIKKKKKNEPDGFDRFNRVSNTANVLLNVMFLLMALVCIIPVLLVIAISLSAEASITEYGYHLIPKIVSFEGYEYLAKQSTLIIRALGVSLFVTIVGTVLGILLTTLMGYVLSRPGYKLNGFLTMVVFIPMVFNGGLVSTYFITSQFLNLKDSVWALILPLAVSSFNVVICRTFFKTTVPEELIESAKRLYSLQALLNAIMTNVNMLAQNAAAMGASMADTVANMPKEAARMAIVVVIVLPIACAYPFFQKYFISGLTVGAVKG